MNQEFAISLDLNETLNTGSNTDLDCVLVGEGVLSKIVIFGNKLFANIAGTAVTGAFQGSRDDLVSINSGAVDIESFRNSWRENY